MELNDMKSYIYKLVLHINCDSNLFHERGSDDIYTFLRKKDAVDMYKRHVECSDSDYYGVTLTKEIFSCSPRNNIRIAVECQRGCESELIAKTMYSQEKIENRKVLEEKEQHELEYGVE